MEPDLQIVSIDHTCASVGEREKFAFDRHGAVRAMASLVSSGKASRACAVSTCNRTEIVSSGSDCESVVAWLLEWHSLPGEMASLARRFSGLCAVERLMRLASGIESMVLGETQILGQMKRSFEDHEAAGLAGGLVSAAFRSAFACAKDVRTNTAVGKGAVSMAAAALDVSKSIFGPPADSSVLFVGAGEMVELCAERFLAAGARNMAVANRTVERARALAGKMGARAFSLDSLHDELPSFDTVVTCTASSVPVIGVGAIESALSARKRRPMLFVDLAVPRDVEKEASLMDDVFLYTVDDLAEIVGSNEKARALAAAVASSNISSHMQKFSLSTASKELSDVARDFSSHLDVIRKREVDKAAKAIARGEDPLLVADRMSKAVCAKIAHPVLSSMSSPDKEKREGARKLVATVFGLDGVAKTKQFE